MAEGLGLSRLSFNQVVTVCEIAEVAARRCILSKVPRRVISGLDLAIGISASKLLTVNVGVNLTLSPLAQKVDVDRLSKLLMPRLKQLKVSLGKWQHAS